MDLWDATMLIIGEIALKQDIEVSMYDDKTVMKEDAASLASLKLGYCSCS